MLWEGWGAAGAKAMALRPNSLWSAKAGAIYAFGTQLIADLQWCASHGSPLLATDYDSLVAQRESNS
jgi:hypothetical protein